MSDIFSLHRSGATLLDARGRRFDPRDRQWTSSLQPAAASAAAETLDAVGAVAWLQRESGVPLRVPIGVIGPRDATERQLAIALEVGERLARCGLSVVCGGRHGVMQAACEGVARNGGISIGLIGDTDPSLANPFARVVIATGIGEARNALIARSALCLIAIGDSYGTLSEVALGRHFGKLVVGLEGAAQVDGVVHVATPEEALQRVARVVLALD
jgi:uncharacterized protein (TIGR00725 family)